MRHCRFFILLVLVLLAPAALAEDLVARRGNDSVRFMDKPCVHGDVVATIMLLAPDALDDFKRAEAVFQGHRFAACWRRVGEVYHLVYEDGDQGIVPVQEAKPVPEV